jgi:hypothetical protein
MENFIKNFALRWMRAATTLFSAVILNGLKDRSCNEGFREAEKA